MADHYSHGAQIDATAEAELRRYCSSQPTVDLGFEDLAEFRGGISDEERCEREWTRMEVDDDPNARFHDGRSF